MGVLHPPPSTWSLRSPPSPSLLCNCGGLHCLRCIRTLWEYSYAMWAPGLALQRSVSRDLDGVWEPGLITRQCRDDLAPSRGLLKTSSSLQNCPPRPWTRGTSSPLWLFRAAHSSSRGLKCHLLCEALASPWFPQESFLLLCSQTPHSYTARWCPHHPMSQCTARPPATRGTT